MIRISSRPINQTGQVDSPPMLQKRTRLSRFQIALWITAALLVLLGIGLRAWYVFHEPVLSDGAIVGMMADGVLHGHFTAFYWGQNYGGAEQYVVAAMFALFGSSVWVLKATAILLFLIDCLLVWRVVKQLVENEALAVLAGTIVWAIPQSAIWGSTVESGFKALALTCGLISLLAALHIYGNPSYWRWFAAGGLAVGVGWWASPEVVYYILPTSLILGAAAVKDFRQNFAKRWVLPLAIAVGAFVLGDLPWLWANLQSGLASIKTSS
ncbi:MAG TPA: glycosyltransferase family 39 protein, partial [Acidimicrobiales bacterium]|nr:glycosyltransferase family 39 protein [Acidimicrobiales bacterium]